MAGLPMQWNTTTAAGSQWAQTFTLTKPDGTPLDITGLVWEFVIRPAVTDTAQPPLVKVTTTASSQGQITVTTSTASVQVVLAPAATSLLGRGARPFSLWSNPGTPTAVCWVEGSFHSQPVAGP
ncbi:hypothetical protein ACFQ6V_09120 [Streptomyces roseifaciens]